MLITLVLSFRNSFQETKKMDCDAYLVRVRDRSKFMGKPGRDHRQGAKTFFEKKRAKTFFEENQWAMSVKRVNFFGSIDSGVFI